MSACNFSVQFQGAAEDVLAKAKNTVEKQGGNFTGDLNAGNFDLSIFGNTIAGSYSVAGQQLNIIIDSKPFLVPCSTIESFLTSQLN
ncbi:MAG: hypothetical protein ABIW38_12340 [Ferruginibacter sp.]